MENIIESWMNTWEVQGPAFAIGQLVGVILLIYGGYRLIKKLIKKDKK